jgi:hypothetical protein
VVQEPTGPNLSPRWKIGVIFTMINGSSVLIYLTTVASQEAMVMAAGLTR